MKYRAQDQQGDYQIGRPGIFLVDTPAAVAQAIKTRLLLMAGEWFLNTDEGTHYEQILGYGTQNTRDLVVRERILDTAGVTELLEYGSQVVGRKFTVAARVLTQYSEQPITVALEF